MTRSAEQTITLSAAYIEWAHRPGSDDGRPGAVEIIRQTGGRWQGRVKLTLTPEVVAELRTVAKDWADADHDREAVPWGYTRTARRILAEVPAPPGEVDYVACAGCYRPIDSRQGRTCADCRALEATR